MVTVVAASVTVAYRKPLGAALGSKSNPGVEPPPTLSLSKEYIYAGGRLIATEEPGTGCGAGPSAPGQLDATAVASGVVSLTWPASPGAVDHYQVERKQSVPDSSYVVVNQYVPPAPIVSVNDNVSTGVVAYVYRVRAFDSGGCASQYGPADLATSIIFANDPLVSQLTVISAVHVTQLRQAVDAVRMTAGLGAFSWTDPPGTNPSALVGTPVKAAQVIQLREGLNQALLALGFQAMPPDSTIAVGSKVYAAHLQDIRVRVK